MKMLWKCTGTFTGLHKKVRILSLWSGPGGLEPKESAVFQTVLALQRLDPSRDVRQTFMQVIERQQNEKEVERNIIFGLQGFRGGLILSPQMAN